MCGDERGGVNFKHRRGRIGYIGAGLRRVDAIRRLKANSSGKRECVVIMRERNGKSLAFVVRSEGDAGRSCAIMSQPCQRSMPMKGADGMPFTLAGKRTASITR